MTKQRIPQKEEMEILPPLKEGDPSQLNVDILAQISQYTERPDLFLETIEKYDPGFIKKLTENTEEFSKKSRLSRFNFGRIQAYASLLIQVIAAIMTLSVVAYLAYDKQLGFVHLIGIAVLYAVTQGGASGFNKIITSISDALKKYKK